MSVYEQLYQRLRPALFAMSTHGTKVDVAGMALLEAEWRSRTIAIKDEIHQITGGAILWAIKEELSEEAKAANLERARALKSWNDRPKGRGASKTPEVQALQQVLEAARQALASLKQDGRYYQRTPGVGLSDRAIKDFLRGKGIKLPTKRNKENGRVTETVDDIALKKIARGRPDLRSLVGLILEHRKCLKMASTYCDPEKVDGDGRIRCQWKPCGTQTGRLASSENPLGGGLNQQNIPDHDDYGFRIKRLFLPDEGCLLLKLDLSMAEARNFFWRTGDPQLQEIAASRPSEVDVYKWIASLILGKDASEVSKEERQICGKKIGLSSNYGVGPKRMSDSLLKEGYYFSEKTCAELQGKLFSALPGIQKHQSKVISSSIQERKSTGRIRIRNSFGREIEFVHERLDIPLYHRLFAWPSQCCDNQTEVLTDKGFVLFPWLAASARVATWAPGGTISFEVPKALQSYHFKGNLIEFENRHFNQVVTPNHRIPYTNQLGHYFVKQADEIGGSSRKGFFVSGGLKIGIDLPDSLIQLLVAIQADGSIYGRRIRFRFSKGRKIGRLQEILTDLGQPFNVNSQLSDRTTRIETDIPAKLYRYLNIGKEFTWTLLELSSRSLKVLCEELAYWDGTQYGKSIRYNSNSLQNIEVVQACGFMAGYRSTLGKCEDNYYIHLNPTMKTHLGGTKLIPYNGMVYCVTTSTGFFVVRRKGRVSVTHNSDIGDHNNQLGLVPFWYERRAVGWLSQHNAVVHDENLISVRPEEAWPVAQFMANSLERPYDVGGMGKLSIPVQIGLGLNWQDMEEFKQLPSRDEFMAKVEMLCRMAGIRRNF